MGAGSAMVFAAAGIPTTLLARTRDKARLGQARVEKLAKSEAISRFLSVGTYDDDLDREVAAADLVFEAVSEELALKRAMFGRIDGVRRPGALVATVSSGLSIAGLCAERSDDFRRHFLGIHFVNPNENVDWDTVPFAVNTELREWATPAAGIRRGPLRPLRNAAPTSM